MKTWNWMALIGIAGLLAGACGDDSETETSGPAGSGAASSTTAGPAVGSTGMSSSSTSMTGSGICNSPVTIDGDVFDGCLSANCCESFDPCFADTDCQACLENPGGAGCEGNTMYQAFATCYADSCPNSICGTTLATGSPNLNGCITGSCCTTFTACEADAACNACLLDPMGAGCDTLMLFTDYTTCRETNCPDDICGTQIIFAITYESNMSQDVAYDSNFCAQTNCCMDLQSCADPSNDGYLEMNDPEVQACLACLTNQAGCPGGAVQTAADAFDACYMTNCGQ